MNSRPLDSRQTGARNERLVLRLLRERGPLSQKQLCQETRLGSSTASTIVSRLRDKGLVRETQGTSNTRGPKPVMLRINPEGRSLVGLELTPTAARIELFDFAVTSRDRAEVPLIARDAAGVVKLLTVQILGLLAKHQIPAERVQAVGVTLSGSVSAEGVVELSSTLGWKQVPLRERLSRSLGVPVQVFSTRVRLLAELRLPPEPGTRHVLYVNVADGVGVNAVIDGHLVHGCGNRAGELGHVVVDPEGPFCGCGHRGCLETLISGPALARRIREDLRDGRSSLLTERLSDEDTDRTLIHKWGLALQAGDAYARGLCDFVATRLSHALALAINLFDPQVLILAGYVCDQCADAVIAAIETSRDTEIYDGRTRRLTIRRARAGWSRCTRGAAIAVLNDAP